MKKLQLSQFIDNTIESLEEKCLIWELNVYTSSGQFDLVLRTKWKLAQLAQQGGNI